MVDKIDKETELLRNTFKDNENLLKKLRSLFFGLALSDEDKAFIKETFKNQDLRDTFRKKIYAKRGDDANLGNIADFWVSIGDDKLLAASPEQIYMIVESRRKLYDMFEKAMALLENPDGEKLELDFIPSPFAEANMIETGVDLMARNKYLNAIESGLSFINIIANTKDKTPEEIKEQLKKNSTK